MDFVVYVDFLCACFFTGIIILVMMMTMWDAMWEEEK
jgi:hypothetical protein